MGLFINALALTVITALAFGSDCIYDDYEFDIEEKYAPPGQCMEYTCTGKNSMEGLTCADFAVQPHCKKTEMDMDLPYPQCCPGEECEAQ